MKSFRGRLWAEDGPYCLNQWQCHFYKRKLRSLAEMSGLPPTHPPRRRIQVQSQLVIAWQCTTESCTMTLMTWFFMTSFHGCNCNTNAVKRILSLRSWKNKLFDTWRIMLILLAVYSNISLFLKYSNQYLVLVLLPNTNTEVYPRIIPNQVFKILKINFEIVEMKPCIPS